MVDVVAAIVVLVDVEDVVVVLAVVVVETWVAGAAEATVVVEVPAATRVSGSPPPSWRIPITTRTAPIEAVTMPNHLVLTVQIPARSFIRSIVGRQVDGSGPGIPLSHVFGPGPFHPRGLSRSRLRLAGRQHPR
jgi:hypothetical protein